MTSLGVEWGAKYTLTGPDGTVVVFNDSTDPNFIGVLSPESSGLDSADVREDATDATEEDGGHHGDFFEGRRPVVLQGTIIASSATQRNERVAKLKRASRALRRDATLEWQPAGGAKVELKLRRQQPLRVTKGFVKEFQLPLVAADIFPKSTTTRTKTSMFDMSLFSTTKNIDKFALNATNIYYSNRLLTGIGRSKLDGSEVNDTFIATENGPTGITLDASFVYWGSTTKYIGRATLAGGSINNKFIEIGVGITNANTITNAGGFLYWGNELSQYIVRSTVAGGEVKEKFVEGCESVRDITTDGTTWLYFANGSANDVGRAPLAGGAATPKFIAVSGVLNSVAIDSTYIYWGGGTGRTTIGRAKLNGTEVIEEYIQLGEEIEDLWVAGGYLYFTGNSGLVGKIELAVVNKEIKLTNEGDTGASPTVKLYGPFASAKLENVTTDEKLVLEGTLSATDYLTIDFKNHTIKKNGTEYRYDMLNFSQSKWWKLEPGENTIVVTGGTAEFSWQDTFI